MELIIEVVIAMIALAAALFVSLTFVVWRAAKAMEDAFISHH